MRRVLVCLFGGQIRYSTLTCKLGLISGRIWWVRRSSERYRIRKARGNYVGLRALVVTLLESGKLSQVTIDENGMLMFFAAVLYSFLMIVMIVTSVTGSLIMFTILNLVRILEILLCSQDMLRIHNQISPVIVRTDAISLPSSTLLIQGSPGNHILFNHCSHFFPLSRTRTDITLRQFVYTKSAATYKGWSTDSS